MDLVEYMFKNKFVKKIDKKIYQMFNFLHIFTL